MRLLFFGGGTRVSVESVLTRSDELEAGRTGHRPDFVGGGQGPVMGCSAMQKKKNRVHYNDTKISCN